MVSFRRTLSFLLLLLTLQAAAAPAAPQRERRAESREDEVGLRFTNQLRSLFGRFRDGDLDHAFDTASAIVCSELTSGDGEWRPVAFFNSDRKLGDWYHATLEEVKGDLSQFIFAGSCGTEQSSVKLVTKVPYRDSVDRYTDGRIRFDQIRILTNSAVQAAFDSQVRSYQFDLPFLYLNRDVRGRDPVYTTMPASNDDRPVANLINRWDCKSVRASDVTFHFLICQTSVFNRGEEKYFRRGGSGAFGYFILSDGKEAQTSAKLSFNIDEAGNAKPEPPPVEPKEPVRAPAAVAAPVDAGASVWETPKPSMKLGELENKEFRVLFSPQTWNGKVTSAQLLSDQKLIALAKTPDADYCTWRPTTSALVSRVASKEPDSDVDYVASFTTLFNVDMKTHTGARLGTLQCSFSKAAVLADVTVERWVNVVGAHLTLEFRP